MFSGTGVQPLLFDRLPVASIHDRRGHCANRTSREVRTAITWRRGGGAEAVPSADGRLTKTPTSVTTRWDYAKCAVAMTGVSAIIVWWLSRTQPLRTSTGGSHRPTAPHFPAGPARTSPTNASPTDEKNPFLTAARWVLTAIALAIVVNLVSSQWGWKTLGPILAIAAWFAFLAFIRWLPDKSRLARYILLTLLLLLAAVAAIPSLFIGGDEAELKSWLLRSAVALAALLGALAVGAPGALMDPEIFPFAFMAAWFVALGAPMPLWAKIALGVMAFCAYILAVLSIHPGTEDAMRELAFRMRSGWMWLLEEQDNPAAIPSSGSRKDTA